MIATGDLIRVRTLKVDDAELPRVVEAMLDYQDKTFNVEFVFDTDEFGTCVVLEGNKYFWKPEWLEKMPEYYKYKDILQIKELN